MQPEDPAASLRGNRRVAIAVDVRLEFDRFSGFLDEMASNLSEGGMFVRTRNLRPVGSRLRFEISLSDNWPLVRGTGEVMWTRWRDGGPQEPAGMGVRFEILDQESRELIERVVAERRRSGHSPFDLASAAPAADETPPAAEMAAPLATLAELEPPPPILEMPALEGLPHFEPKAPDQAASLVGSLPQLAAVVVSSPTSSVTARPKESGVEAVRSWARSEVPLPESVVRAPVAAAKAAPPPRAWTPQPSPPTPLAAMPVADSVVDQHLDEELPSRPARSRLLLATGALVLAAVLATGGWFVFRSRSQATEGNAVPLATTAPAVVAEQSNSEVQSPARAPAGEAGAVSAAAAAAPADAGATKPFAALERITWEPVAGGTQVTLWLDGTVSRDAIRHSRIQTGGTRELLQLGGARRAFAGGRLEVGSRELLRIRTGFHQGPSGAEQHVVFDLAGPGVSLLGIDVAGEQILVRLGPG